MPFKAWTPHNTTYLNLQHTKIRENAQNIEKKREKEKRDVGLFVDGVGEG